MKCVGREPPNSELAERVIWFLDLPTYVFAQLQTKEMTFSAVNDCTKSAGHSNE